MITFDPLWKTLQQKGISQYKLIKEYNLSSGTLDALRKGKSITLNTLDDLCRIIGCNVEDIIAYVSNESDGK